MLKVINSIIMCFRNIFLGSGLLRQEYNRNLKKNKMVDVCKILF